MAAMGFLRGTLMASIRKVLDRCCMAVESSCREMFG